MTITNFETTKVSKKGAVIIPLHLRKRFGLSEGSLVIAEEKEEGILIRPAEILPVENYSQERVAEFLLNSAIDLREYEEAVESVKNMGLDPNKIVHQKPEI